MQTGGTAGSTDAAGQGGIDTGGIDAGGGTGGVSGRGVDEGGRGATDGAGGKGGKGGKGGNAGGPPLVGGAGGEAGSSGAEEGGGAGTPNPQDPCYGFVAEASMLPSPPTTGVTRPTGTPGGLKVVNWAGFLGALSFTFDDSLQTQLDNYSGLNGVGVPMTFYLVCENDGKKQGWKTAFEDGHELGNHTMHHCYANGTGCGWGVFSNVDAELDDCNAHLQSAFGVPGVYSMASPMGDSGWDAPAGERFLLNRGVNDSAGGVRPNDATDPYNLPCHVAAKGERAASGSPNFNAVTDSVRTNGSWRIILNHALSAALDTNLGYNPTDPAEVIAAMTYSKSFGDVWVDTVTSIGAYWRAQKALSTVTPVAAGRDAVYTWTLPAHFPPGRYVRIEVDGGTPKQCGQPLPWSDHGYYEVALDLGTLTLSP